MEAELNGTIQGKWEISTIRRVRKCGLANSPISRDFAVVAWQEIWPDKISSTLCIIDLVSQSIISNRL